MAGHAWPKKKKIYTRSLRLYPDLMEGRLGLDDRVLCFHAMIFFINLACTILG